MISGKKEVDRLKRLEAETQRLRQDETRDGGEAAECPRGEKDCANCNIADCPGEEG